MLGQSVYMGGLPTPEQLLNAIATPSFGQNARRKWTSKYDELTIAAATTDYIYFDTAAGNFFLRNARFPISGDEVFFITSFDLYLDAIVTTAQFAQMDEIMGRSFLEITINQRQQIKVPLIEILSFYYEDTIGTPVTSSSRPRFHSAKRKLQYPIIMNSTASVQYKLTLSAAAATALDTFAARLGLYGIQFDKLDTFFYDVWKGSEFQKVDYTMYQTNIVPTANQNEYSLFQPAGQAETDYSKLFPMSEIERFDCYALEIGFFPSATTSAVQAVFEDRRDNLFTIQVENVQLFQAQIKDFLSLSNNFVSTFQDAGAVATALIIRDVLRQNLTLEVPLTFPSKSNVQVSLVQPAASLEANDYFVTLMKGVLVRRVV